MKRIISILTLIAILCTIAPTVFAVVTSPTVTTIDGNDSASGSYIPTGYTYYKIDSGDSKTYNLKFNSSGAIDSNGSISISVVVGTQSGTDYTQVLSWQSSIPLYAVIVKGSSSFNFYTYTNTESSGTNLTSPLNKNDKPADVSHVSLIFNASLGATPSPSPTIAPSAEPTATPTSEPTSTPTATPTSEPTTTPTSEPTVAPTTSPTAEPTATPTSESTSAPTVAPTAESNSTPTPLPTTEATSAPTIAPTATPQPLNEQYNLTKRVYIYDEKNGSTVGYISPQTVELVAKDGNWYKIQTWVGEKWIDINEKEIYDLTKRVHLYDTKGGTVDCGYISPQSVTVIEKDGNWYKIQTWQGEKWININESEITISPPSSNEKYTLVKRLSIYNDKGCTIPVGYISPQDVEVVLKDGGWYKIVTWTGFKWININESEYVLEDMSGYETYLLTKRLNFYDTMNGPTASGYISSQIVYVIGKNGSWYNIFTWSGRKWVNIDEPEVQITVVPGDSSCICTYYVEYYTLAKRIHLFDNKGDSQAVGYISPQTVTVVSKDTNWYKIKTWLGDKWINIDESEVTLDAPVAYEKYNLTKILFLYNSKDGSTDGYYVNAQIVNVIIKDGSWYKIQTWLGDMWINIDQASINIS